jgi:hypothetical protein
MISHKNKYIYIHIPKTGGSSIERALLYSDNIKFETGRSLLLTLEEEIRESYKLQVMKNGQLIHQSHYPLNKFDLEFQKSYYCFTFIRNPWDLLVSTYEFSRQFRGKGYWLNVSFEDFLLRNKIKPAPWHMLPQYSFINENINFIGRYENLQGDFDKVCEELKLPQQKLAHVFKTERKQYQDYYTEETKNFVAKKYKIDIEVFRYKF